MYPMRLYPGLLVYMDYVHIGGALMYGFTIIRTVVRIVGMGRMSHICNTKCSRL